MDDTPARLVRRAHEARSAAYAPYSDYRVGAALQTADETVFTGCNVENANFSNSFHAEEVALGSAVAAGYREFAGLAVASAAEDGVLPCGRCRQSLVEFCDEEFPIYVPGDASDGDGDASDGDGDGGGRSDTPQTYRLGDLLPDAIGPTALGVDP